MWIAVLSCALLLLHSAVAETHYAVYSSFLMRAAKPAKICAQVTGAEEFLPLTIILEHPTWGTPVSFCNENLPAGDTAKCFTADIPSIGQADIAYLTVQVGNLTERKSVVVNGEKPFCAGQMSQPIYKAGDTVQGRILCLTNDFLPAKQKIWLIELTDPNGNLLMQERNITSEHHFSTFEYRLIDEAETGFYQIRADMENGFTVYLSFEVKKYVKPKFDASLTAPPSVNILDKEMTVTISGTYTFEKNLVAKAEISVCRKPNTWGPADTCNLNENGICEKFSGSLGPDGTWNVTVNLDQFQLTHSGLQSSLSIDSTITEEGTDVQVTRSAWVWISSQSPTPYFDYPRMQSYFKPGINYTGALVLKDDSNKAIYNETITLTVDYKPVATCATDRDGICSFSIDTSEMKGDSLVIEAQYNNRQHCYQSRLGNTYNPSVQYTVNLFYSRSGSYVQLDPVLEEQRCGNTLYIQGACSLNPENLAAGAQSASLMYMITANGDVKRDGQVEVALGSGNKGYFSIAVLVNEEIAPAAKIMVSMLLKNGEIVAHSQRFNVQRCFRHQVSLAFSPEKARPGSEVSLTVSAASGASCGIRSIDQSINILSGGPAQSMGDVVYNNRPSTELWGTWVDGFNLRESDPPCITKPDKIIEGLRYEAVESKTSGSAADEFENNGVRVLASTDPRKPVLCPKPNPCPQPIHPIAVDGAGGGAGWGAGGGFGGGSMTLSAGKEAARDGAFASAAAGAAVVASFRTFFTDTWVYTSIKLADDGTKQQLQLTVPGDITTYDTTAFCFSDSLGFGATKDSTNFTAFQDFFVEAALPHSVVAGEVFVLKVTAFFYLNTCKLVQVDLPGSSDYTFELLEVENDHCICQNGRKTYAYSVNVTKPGTVNITVTAETKSDSSCSGEDSGNNYKDTVIRPLIVQPEGMRREETQSALICTKGDTTSQTITVTLPENLVQYSAKVHITCLGDPLGISVRNLDNLVQMPTGCGEQTVSGIISNIVVYKYLDSIQSLDEETKQKILNNLRNGYARMTLFYENVGCMCTWSRNIYWPGTRDCNRWLTAKSYGALVKAREIGVFIDDKMVTQMESWLASQQDDQTGAFLSDGRSYNYLMNGNVSYTANVAEAFLNAGHNRSHPVLGMAFRYLDTQIESSDDAVGQVLSCYVYGLAGDVEKQNILLAKLKAKTLEDARGVSLKICDEQTYTPFFNSFPRRDCSATIFTTAYYLMSMLRGPNLSKNGLTYAASIARWIASQINGNGGFASTMDTPAAFEAMAKFQQIITITKSDSNTVTLKSGSDVVHQFTTNSDNNLVLQRATLPNVPASYEAEVTGTGCVFVQTTLVYHMKAENMATSFDLKVWTSTKDGNNGDQSSYNLHFNVSYQGKKKSSEMAILDVTLPSGYRVEESSLDPLLQKGVCQRFETIPQGHVILYMNQVTNETTSGVFLVEQTTVVRNLKPAQVSIYNYYDEGESGYATYALPHQLPTSE